MSEIRQTMRPEPSDYGIDGGDPEIDQALADLVEMGLVVDSGQRSFRTASGGSCGSQSRPKSEVNSASCAGKYPCFLRGLLYQVQIIIAPLPSSLNRSRQRASKGLHVCRKWAPMNTKSEHRDINAPHHPHS
jgi:hypothetical protein